MDMQEKINFVKDNFDCNISLLLLNVDIEIFLEDCKEIAYFIKRKKIESILDIDVKEKINKIVKKYRNTNIYKENAFSILIQKLVYVYCYELEVSFAVLKVGEKMRKYCIGIERYKEKILEEVREKIENTEIIFNTPYLKIKSYEIQYIKYMKKTNYCFDNFYELVYKNSQNAFIPAFNANSDEVLMKAVPLDRLYNKNKIKSIKESHDFQINSEWFILSNIYSEFLHNLIITLELYLKMVIVAVSLKDEKDEKEILKKLRNLGHSYISLLGELENKDNCTENSRIGVNKNHIAKQINILSKHHKHILDALDKSCILEQVRYAENTGVENINMLPTTNEILKLFVFLNNSYNEIMSYRRWLDIDVNDKFIIKDFVDIEIYNPKDRIKE